MTRTPDRSLLVARRAAVAFGALTALAFGLIVLGALVRAHGAGLACPDWPLCFGSVIPAFDFGVAFEWGHRALAGTLTLGIAASTFWVLRERALRPVVGRALALVWALLCVQILLGGLTVLLGLAPWTVTSHLLLGNCLCAALLWCSRSLSEHGSAVLAAPLPSHVRGLALASAGFVALQLALGGLVSSHYAGLACYEFPTCDGVSFAPAFTGLVGLHVLHRFGAYAVATVFILLVWATWGSGEPAARIARSALRVVALQVAVGVANVWLRLPVEMTGLHSALAAALVLQCALLVREVLLQRPERAMAGGVEPALGMP
jgi:cytochrome c oxidase assembly protein subunit 15